MKDSKTRAPRGHVPICRACGSPGRIHKTDKYTSTTKEISCVCTNLDCERKWVIGVEEVRVIRPSALGPQLTDTQHSCMPA